MSSFKLSHEEIENILHLVIDANTHRQDLNEGITEFVKMVRECGLSERILKQMLRTAIRYGAINNYQNTQGTIKALRDLRKEVGLSASGKTVKKPQPTVDKLPSPLQYLK